MVSNDGRVSAGLHGEDTDKLKLSLGIGAESVDSNDATSAEFLDVVDVVDEI